MPKVRLTLFNGAKTKEAWNPDSPEFIDDWKPEEKSIVCDEVQLTYGQHLKVSADGKMVDMPITFDGFVLHEGVYYGDFVVTA